VQTATRSLDLEILGADGNSGKPCFDGTAKVMIMSEDKPVELTQLAGKRTLVTGATGEVGRAICRQLAAEGCRLILWGRNAAQLGQIADDLGDAVESWHSVDLLDEEAIDRGLDKALAQAPVDILVHAACAPLGHSEFGAADNLAEIRTHWKVSAAAFAQIASRLLPHMPSGSAIVALLTEAVLDAPPLKMSAYVSGKMAAWGLVRSIAAEFGPQGIRCNAVSPSLMHTPFSKDMSVLTKQVEAAKNPLRRLCTVEDVANAVSYLCGPGAAYVNGVNLPVSGGGKMP
jgi:NAD(P)-dependent dehydrogenase (short-subunit alcohol dehydrogenase family)